MERQVAYVSTLAGNLNAVTEECYINFTQKNNENRQTCAYNT